MYSKIQPREGELKKKKAIESLSVEYEKGENLLFIPRLLKNGR